MNRNVLINVCTFELNQSLNSFHWRSIKSFTFLEIWFTACSLWMALEMFFWKNIGNLLYLDPLSTTSSTLRYLLFPSTISSKDDFLFLQNKATNPIDIPPVIATPHHYLISIYRLKGHLENTVVTEKFVGSWSWNKISETWHKLQFPVLQV